MPPPDSPSRPWPLRPAVEQDAAELQDLIALSVWELQAEHYTAEQREAAIGTAFGVDRQLIRDGTYWVAEDAGKIVGCGGWSWRQKIYGGDGHQLGEGTPLDPAHDAARVRAFFVHPGWARRGIGRSLLQACEAAIRNAGFHRAEMVATLTGEALYRSLGYEVMTREDVPIPGGLTLGVVRMGKDLG